MAPPSDLAQQNARRAFFVLRNCPFCSGTGREDERECLRCDGSGDLLGALLLRAYDAGVRDASGRLNFVCQEFQGIIRQVEEESLVEFTTDSIRRRVREVRSRSGAPDHEEDERT